MPSGDNRVLGPASTPAAARPHRVALAAWPATVAERRTATLPALLGHLVAAGYEGLEFDCGAFARYFPADAPPAVARKARSAVEAAGLRVFGARLRVADAQLRALRWMEGVVAEMALVQELGGEYVDYQFQIHPDYYRTAGAYRADEEYLRWCAEAVSGLRKHAGRLGLNFYLEIHTDCVTEDPAALSRLLDLVPCELTGDMSHFFARGFVRGGDVAKALAHVGHAHVRMARLYGDLSAAVPDPQADWEAGGLTWQMFQFVKPSLRGGLSSRTICGETGPMHLVADTLTQDAALVPLYRAMARYADASAQGLAIAVDDPADLKPWG